MCRSIGGRTFASVVALECGPTPDGVALCHWEIQFEDGRFDRRVSDYGTG